MATSSAPTRTDRDPALIPAEEVAQGLRVDPATGLSSQEAAARLGDHGPNVLIAAQRDPAWKRMLAQFADPLIYLLLAAIVISLAAWLAEGAGGVPVDALVIALIVIANAVIGFVQENKAADAVAALADMTAAHANVLRDGRLTEIASDGIVPGDILALAEGDAVGADARLLSASSLQVQEASLTGESEAVTKDPLPIGAPVPLGDRLNMVYKGTAVARGVGRAVVTGTGMDTEMGRIATLLEQTRDDPSPLQDEIARISKLLGMLVIAIAVVVMGALVMINGVSSLGEAVDILLMGVSLAVAAVPEGLPAILSLVLAIGVQVMARRNAVMKNLHSVETLGAVSVICSDKTGTLTRNEMTLREVRTASGRVKLSGTGYAPTGEVRLLGRDEAAVAAEVEWALGAGMLANNSQLEQVDGVWQIHGDPTEAAFLVAGRKLEGLDERISGYQREGEAPFDSDRKLMSVLGHHRDRGPSMVFTKGAPDVLLERCTDERVGGGTRPLTRERREAISAAIIDLSEEGFRTLGVASREADEPASDFDEQAEHDLVWAGFVGIIDPPREEAVGAIREAHRAGIRTVMITGDHPVTASKIAADLGIVEGETRPTAVTGRELDALDDEGWRRTVAATSVFARVSPEHKLRIVDALQEQGEIVSMTGDGVNDAPALKSADIGIAMGITGTEVTKEAAEMILGDDNYSTIVAAVAQGRVIYDNIRKFIRYLLSSNMGEVATVFLGVVLAGVIGLSDPGNPGATVVPLLATQILWINLVTDSGPALAMGIDPEIDDVMARRPRSRDANIIDSHMWWRIIGIGAVMGLVSLVIYDLSLPGGLLTGLEHLAPAGAELVTARTTVFTALVFMQLFNALNSRADTASAFDHLFTNRWLWLSFAAVVVGQILVVEVPFLQDAFATTSLDLIHWGIAVAAGLVVLGFEEIVKLIRRATAGRDPGGRSDATAVQAAAHR